MTQDCSPSLSIADENNNSCNKCFPNGIHVTEADVKSDSAIKKMSGGEGKGGEDDGYKPLPWGYLYVQNRHVELFRKQMEDYNLSHPDCAHKCFVHYSSYNYRPKAKGKGVVQKQKPTVSGLVFLQGETKGLQAFLRSNYPRYHLVNDCSTGKPASIDHRFMKPFMDIVISHPENVTFLRDPFVKFAKDHVRLRVLTGLFKGLEGYIVRVDRDRQLVMELGGYAVAIRGVHNEDFAVVE